MCWRPVCYLILNLSLHVLVGILVSLAFRNVPNYASAALRRTTRWLKAILRFQNSYKGRPFLQWILQLNKPQFYYPKHLFKDFLSFKHLIQDVRSLFRRHRSHSPRHCRCQCRPAERRPDLQQRRRPPRRLFHYGKWQ